MVKQTTFRASWSLDFTHLSICIKNYDCCPTSLFPGLSKISLDCRTILPTAEKPSGGSNPCHDSSRTVSVTVFLISPGDGMLVSTANCLIRNSTPNSQPLSQLLLGATFDLETEQTSWQLLSRSWSPICRQLLAHSLSLWHKSSQKYLSTC